MSNFLGRLETAVDHYAIVTLLVGLPTALGAFILASI